VPLTQIWPDIPPGNFFLAALLFRYMDMRILPLSLVFCVVLIGAGCVDSPGPLAEREPGPVIPDEGTSVSGLMFVSDFEGGQAYRTLSGTYPVLNLRGSWIEMGRQYGGLAGDDLRMFHESIVEDLTRRGVSDEHRHSEALRFYHGHSPELQEVLQGISQTSGLTMDEVMVVNAGMLLLTDAILLERLPGVPEDVQNGCSGIAVWDGYTEDGTLLFGRNWDVDRASMKGYMEYLSVVVMHPDDGYSYANIHPLGNVYLETGMNSHGLFIELNNGEHSDTRSYPDREDTTSVLVRALTESRDVSEAVALLKDTPADISYILQIADPEYGVSLERATFDARVRDSDDSGLVIAVNHFIPPYPPAWEGKINPPRLPEHDPRYENMVHLAQSGSYKGLFTVDLMKQYLSVPLEDGGAYHYGTVYQVIAVPGTRTIWLHAGEYADWEEVPLTALLR